MTTRDRGHLRPTSRRERGFTLVEVLAALVLIGIVLPVAMRGVSLALAAASSARHVSLAASLAEAKLNQLAVEGASSVSGASGDFSPEHPEYRWTCQTAVRSYGLTELAIQVTWTERGQEQSLILTTLTQSGTATSSSTGVLP